MYKLVWFYLFLFVVFSCSSCSNKQYQALFQRKDTISSRSSEKYPDSIVYYRIKPQDQLQIRNLQDIKYIVSQVPESQTASGGTSAQGQTFEVKENGTITLPVVGTITVAGLTRVEAENLIEGLYRKTLLKDPIIDLKITNLKVTIFGEIKSQGNFPLLKDKTTLIEIIGEAGGLSEGADETTVKIIRGTQKDPLVTTIDLSDISSINDPQAMLQNGDIIYISKNRRANRNDKIQNFSSIFQPAILLFNTALIILTLTRH